MGLTMRFLLAVFCGTVLLCPPARADEASKNAKVEELLKASNVDRMMEQMTDQMKAMTASQFNSMNLSAEERKTTQDMQDRIVALVVERWGKMRPMLVKVYADTYTEEEVDGILAFYKSPAGQAMLQKMPALMQRSMAVGQQMVADLMPEIQKMAAETAEKMKQKK